MRRTVVNNLLIEFREKSPGKFNFVKRDEFGFIKFSVDLMVNEVADGFGTKAFQDVQAYINSVDHLKQICKDYGWLAEEPDQISQEEFDEIMKHPGLRWNMIRDGQDSIKFPTIQIWEDTDGLVFWEYLPNGITETSTNNGTTSLSLYSFLDKQERRKESRNA